mmetsp:Transcript_4740/g.7150  ORF Transcript_4740/g.7150 Transcript_4740/m.7150 type:complete len:83 (+) Transcript_4740:905-1153(+)
MFNSYFELHFIEFLELIARIGNLVYTYHTEDPFDKPSIEYSLTEKIELVLEKLIRTHVPYLPLNSVQNNTEEDATEYIHPDD